MSACPSEFFVAAGKSASIDRYIYCRLLRLKLLLNICQSHNCEEIMPSPNFFLYFYCQITRS